MLRKHLLRFIKNINGNTIGFLAYNCAEFAYNIATETEAGTAYFNEGRIRESIRNTKASADVVIVITHCGTEHVTTPDARQQRWAKVYTSAGADFVIGGHPHVRQAPEEIHGKTVVHSVGNFMFPGQSWNPEAQKGWAVEIIIDNGLVEGYALLESEMDQDGVPSWVE